MAQCICAKVMSDRESCDTSHPSLLLYNDLLQCASADHRVPVHLFQNEAMLCRPAGRIARALQGCCWAELGLEVKVNFTAQHTDGAATQPCIASDRWLACPCAVFRAVAAAPPGCPAASKRCSRQEVDIASLHCLLLRPQPCMPSKQVADIRDVLSMAVLGARSQAGDEDTRLPQLLAAVVHLHHVSPRGAALPVQPPALPAKTEVRSCVLPA